MDRLLRRAALAVDGGRGDLDRESPAASTAWRAMFTACSPVCMTHPKTTSSTIAGIDRRAAGHLAQHVRGEHHRVHVAKIAVALVAAAHRGAHRFDDHDVSHGST